MRFLPVLALFAFACTTESTDSGSGTLDPSNNGSNDCSGTAPVIDNFEASDQGQTATDSDSGKTYPVIDLMIEYSDDDGDAHVISTDVWWDDVIDGTVDVTKNPDTSTAPQALKDNDGNTVEECAGSGGTLDLGLMVAGGGLEYETTYDFAVIVYDNAKMASEPAFASGLTPAELPQ